MKPADLSPIQPLNEMLLGQVRVKLAVEYKAIYKKQHVMDGGILY